MLIDIHCHYSFTRLPARATPRFSFEPAEPPLPSGAGPDGAAATSALRPTDFDACVSPRALRRWPWRLARRLAGVTTDDRELDAALKARYRQHLFAPGPIDRFVLLAFDAVHDDGGRCPLLPHRRGVLGSDLYVSNSFVRAACQEHPDRFLFGASVHPYRADAVAAVEEVFAAGACLLKWLPLHQNIDLADPRSLAVLRRCAALGLPLLVHYNEEYTLATNRAEYRPVAPVLEVLRALRRERALPTIIFAHAATPVYPWGDRRSHQLLLDALADEFADAPLFADISALTTWTKVPHLRGLLERRDLHRKLLFGSDFPVPVLLQRVRRRLGGAYDRIRRISSWPQRAACAARALGFEEIVFQRAAELLPNVNFFGSRSAAARV